MPDIKQMQAQLTKMMEQLGTMDPGQQSVPSPPPPSKLKEPRFYCERHGEIGTWVLNMACLDAKGNAVKQEFYCMLCFFELMDKHCCIAKEITDVSEDNGNNREENSRNGIQAQKDSP